MKLLIDTHLLLWAAAGSERLSSAARELIANPLNEKVFSVASLWEVSIKAAIGRADFVVEPAELRAGLLSNGYRELPILGQHVLRVRNLPAVHKDPFDRLLFAQAEVEGLVLVSADAAMAHYGPSVRRV